MTSTPIADLRDAFVRCRDMDAPLEDKLSAYSQAVRRHIPLYADAVDHLVSRLSSSNASAAAPQPGERMPSFVLPDENGKLVSLEDLLRNGPVAIMFHRGHWCPWCRMSAMAMVEMHSQIERVDGQIVAIMPERQKFAVEFKTRVNSSFPVLTDIDNGYALSLNLAIWIGPDLERLLSSYGLSLPDYHGNDAWILPIPATFVVGRDGYVKARFVDPDFRRRMSVEEILAGLKAAA